MAEAEATGKVVLDQKEAPNPYLLMEEIVDKLKILDYENLFCKKK
jgi:hypothetical protein